jgi:hypothetical protein
MSTDPRPLTWLGPSAGRRDRVTSVLFSVLVISLLLPFASRATDSVDPRAADFASSGFAETIATCRLPKTCANKPPRSARSNPASVTGNESIVEDHFVRFDGS